MKILLTLSAIIGLITFQINAQQPTAQRNKKDEERRQETYLNRNTSYADEAANEERRTKAMAAGLEKNRRDYNSRTRIKEIMGF